jgi:hypothetical protein
MKKLHLAFMLIAFSLISQTSYSQQIAANKYNAPKNVSYNHEGTETPDGDSRLESSNPKVVAKFSKMFAGASNQQWKTVGDCSYVSFSNNGCNSRAVFTSTGKMNYLITDVSVDQLPELLRNRIANDYKGYTVSQALEITAFNTVAYQTILENDHHFVKLKYTTDGIEKLVEQAKQNNR